MRSNKYLSLSLFCIIPSKRITVNAAAKTPQGVLCVWGGARKQRRLPSHRITGPRQSTIRAGWGEFVLLFLVLCFWRGRGQFVTASESFGMWWANVSLFPLVYKLLFPAPLTFFVWGFVNAVFVIISILMRHPAPKYLKQTTKQKA